MATPIPLEQSSIIGDLFARHRRKEGETWYLVSCLWYKRWKEYIELSQMNPHINAVSPGPIDNSDLFTVVGGKSTSTLREYLSEYYDFEAVPKVVWDTIIRWYGFKPGQVPIARRIINKERVGLTIEVYLLKLKLSVYRSDRDQVELEFSVLQTVADVENRSRLIFELRRALRLWTSFGPVKQVHLSNPKATLQSMKLCSGVTFVVEECNADGTWQRESTKLPSALALHPAIPPAPPPSASTSTVPITASGVPPGKASGDPPGMSSGPSTSTAKPRSGPALNVPKPLLTASAAAAAYYSTAPNAAGPATAASKPNQPSEFYDGRRGDTGRGLCGLFNLGNTCFMNSAIQCLSNVPLLTHYMLGDDWELELSKNRENGLDGEMTVSFVQLIRRMWSGRYLCAQPRRFKTAMGRYKPDFDGSMQHDCHELMAFILDGLHEALNRVDVPPRRNGVDNGAVETMEVESRSNEEIAEASWREHRKLNDSIIVDLFHGQLQSSLICPACNNSSVTYDPFCCLSLPIPSKDQQRVIEVTFVQLGSTFQPRKYKLTVLSDGHISDICSNLSRFSKISAERMLVVKVCDHRIVSVCSVREKLSVVQPPQDDAQSGEIFVYETPLMDVDTISVAVYTRETWETFVRVCADPFFIFVKRNNCSLSALYDPIRTLLSDFLSTHKSRCIRMMEQSNERKRAKRDGTEDEVPVSDDGSVLSCATSSCDTNADVIGRDENDDDLLCLNYIDQAGFTLDEMPVFDTRNDGTADVLRPAASITMYVAADLRLSGQDRFDIVEKTNMAANSTLAVYSCPPIIHLTDCLNMFTSREQLAQDNIWSCTRCKEQQRAVKKLDIWRLPRILIFHLKRFSYSRQNQGKINTPVNFNIRDLNMWSWVVGPSVGSTNYDLIAVSNHLGCLGSGHYTTFAKNKVDREWYFFDDTQVTKSSEEKVVTSNGYILVYQQQEEKKITSDNPTSEPLARGVPDNPTSSLLSKSVPDNCTSAPLSSHSMISQNSSSEQNQHAVTSTEMDIDTQSTGTSPSNDDTLAESMCISPPCVGESLDSASFVDSRSCGNVILHNGVPEDRAVRQSFDTILCDGLSMDRNVSKSCNGALTCDNMQQTSQSGDRS